MRLKDTQLMLQLVMHAKETLPNQGSYMLKRHFLIRFYFCEDVENSFHLFFLWLVLLRSRVLTSYGYEKFNQLFKNNLALVRFKCLLFSTHTSSFSRGPVPRYKDASVILRLAFLALTCQIKEKQKLEY